MFDFTGNLHSTQKIISMRADLSNFIFLDFLYLNIYIYLGTQFYNNVFIQVYTKVVVCFLHVCSLKTRLFICFFLGQLMVEWTLSKFENIQNESEFLGYNCSQRSKNSRIYWRDSMGCCLSIWKKREQSMFLQNDFTKKWMK